MAFRLTALTAEIDSKPKAAAKRIKDAIAAVGSVPGDRIALVAKHLGVGRRTLYRYVERLAEQGLIGADVLHRPPPGQADNPQ